MDYTKLKLRFEVFALLLTIVAGVFGGVFTLLEYNESKENKKISFAMNFYEKYTNGETSKANYRITGVHLREYESFMSSLSKASEENFEDLRYSLLKKQIYNNRLEKDIVSIISFYNALSICTLENICHKKTVDVLFKSKMKNFYTYFYPYITVLASEWDYGLITPMETYLDVKKEKIFENKIKASRTSE